MSAWENIPSVLSLRDEFNKVNPNRDKGADGTIGDSNHNSSSDHTPDEDSSALRGKDADSKNEVHALDIDSTGPWPGTTFSKLVQAVLDGERRKWQDPNDKCRLNYVIYNRTIYDKDDDFIGRPYTGSDPHTNHAHFSWRYDTSCEQDTRPWGVYKEDEVDEADINAIADRVITKLNTALRDDAHPLSGIAKAIAWKYVGGGIPTGMSTLNVLNSTYHSALAAASMDVDEAAIAAQLAPLITPAIVEALPDHVTLTPEEAQAASEAAVRSVLGQLDQQA